MLAVLPAQCWVNGGPPSATLAHMQRGDRVPCLVILFLDNDITEANIGHNVLNNFQYLQGHVLAYIAMDTVTQYWANVGSAP